ncbi:cyclase family protein [Aggregicoccus sp. 17bor-14]|uniref:cyclase family protein n=1 Tax=Myxococcaceae TaxID=31 RepID=UPI00129C344E|nr:MULTISPECIES: cyclase family protein [Myxococcaceae]MBF5045476.1 cyclase family protein [Simulacricoccus sp. 17bor-14]MRI91214.1 cyclase family protein [Aggregicoccus sp. 17bor-14]
MSALSEGWVDLSVPISPRLPVWPEDPPLRNARTANIHQGDPANVTELRMSAHCGTHVDAPLHFIPGARAVDALDLRALLGPARVLHLDDAPEVRARSLQEAAPKRGERLLLRTRNSEGPWWEQPFKEDFIGLSLDAARVLAEAGVACVGVDYLSVAGFHADGAAVHRTLLEAGVVVIEGLALAALPREAREVELLCLPLRLVGADGSPVRALARPLPEGAR